MWDQQDVDLSGVDFSIAIATGLNLDGSTASPSSTVGHNGYSTNAGGTTEAGAYWKQRCEELMIDCNARSVAAHNLRILNAKVNRQLQESDKVIRNYQQKIVDSLNSIEPIKSELNGVKTQLITEIRERSRHQLEAECQKARAEQIQAFLEKHEREIERLRRQLEQTQAKVAEKMAEAKRLQEKAVTLEGKYIKVKEDCKRKAEELKHNANEISRLKRIIDHANTRIPVRVRGRQRLASVCRNVADREGGSSSEEYHEDAGMDVEQLQVDLLRSMASPPQTGRQQDAVDDTGEELRKEGGIVSITERQRRATYIRPVDGEPRVPAAASLLPQTKAMAVLERKERQEAEGTYTGGVKNLFCGPTGRQAIGRPANSAVDRNARRAKSKAAADSAKEPETVKSISAGEALSIMVAALKDAMQGPMSPIPDALDDRSVELDRSNVAPASSQAFKSQDGADLSVGNVGAVNPQTLDDTHDQYVDHDNASCPTSQAFTGPFAFNSDRSNVGSPSSQALDSHKGLDMGQNNVGCPSPQTLVDQVDRALDVEQVAPMEKENDNPSSACEEQSQLVIAEECPLSVDERPTEQLGPSEQGSPLSEYQQASALTPAMTTVDNAASDNATLILSSPAAEVGKKKRKGPEADTSCSSSRPKRARVASGTARVPHPPMDESAAGCKSAVKSFKENRSYAAILDSMLSGSGTSHVSAYEKWTKKPRSPAETVVCSYIEAIKRHNALPWVATQFKTAVCGPGRRPGRGMVGSSVQPLTSNDKKLSDLLKALLDSANASEWENVPAMMISEIKRQLATAGGELSAVQVEALCRWAFHLCQQQRPSQSFTTAKEILLTALRRECRPVTPQQQLQQYQANLNVFLTLAMAWPAAFKEIVAEPRSDLDRILQAVFHLVLWNSSMKAKANGLLEQCLGRTRDPVEQRPALDVLTREQLGRLSCLCADLQLSKAGVRPPAELAACINKLALLAPFCDESALAASVEPCLISIADWAAINAEDCIARGGPKKLIADIFLLAKLAQFCQPLLMRHIDCIVDSFDSLIFGVSCNAEEDAFRLTSEERTLLIYAAVDLLASVPIFGGDVVKVKELLKRLSVLLEEEKKSKSDAIAQWYVRRCTQVWNYLKE